MLFSFVNDLNQSVEFNVFVRILIAIVLAVIVSLSKDLFTRPVGFRVSVIASIASTIITLVAIYCFNESAGVIIAGLLVSFAIKSTIVFLVSLLIIIASEYNFA